MPKINRNGQAEILTPDQLSELFETLKPPHRLICQICYYTAARVGEVTLLRVEDLINGSIVFRSGNTKTDKTRTVAIAPPLAAAIADAKLPSSGYLFPSPRNPGKPITTVAVDLALREACDYIGLKGVSTHSFRRSLLTHLYRAGHDVKTLQRISGHKSVDSLFLYLDVGHDEAQAALVSFFA